MDYVRRRKLKDRIEHYNELADIERKICNACASCLVEFLTREFMKTNQGWEDKLITVL